MRMVWSRTGVSGGDNPCRRAGECPAGASVQALVPGDDPTTAMSPSLLRDESGSTEARWSSVSRSCLQQQSPLATVV